ncbi:anthranilate synthase component I family protein [Psychrobacter sp. AOP22-C1-C5]|uniref:anthranilate synthase component I family protein n=1 Tax=Psychrobacter sp. AOP22-C1-C5 TaxID=3457716 RepID=UPI0040367E21
MLVANHNTTEQTASAPSPATYPSWRFGDLTAAELMPRLQKYLITQDSKANWQLVWLNNDGRPVIGVLPKTSWSVYPTNHALSDDALAPYKVTKYCRDVCNDDQTFRNKRLTTTHMSYATWQEELIAYSQCYENSSNDLALLDKEQERPNYHHGLIGFIGYDIAAYDLSPNANIQLAAQPCAILGHYDIYLSPINECRKSVWQLKVNKIYDDNNNGENERKNAFITTLTSYLNELDEELSDKSLNRTPLKASSQSTSLALTARWTKNDYQKAFEQTQDYLQQGDCYQINLTQEWHSRLAHQNTFDKSLSNLIDYLPSLHRNTKAPFAGYLESSYLDDEVDTNIQDHTRLSVNSMAKNNTFELLSCSPELFFTFTKDNETGKHHIRTKPIKGTMPRGATPEQDDYYKQQLIDSEKDRAENVMIVDLLRNDLGKYAKIGSVKVPQLFAIESFSNVHHMVSTISAELKTDTHPLTVLFGSLPAGSITGTPKKRAVEIISELEMAPRGAYCGTMGYMNFDGSGQWNVLIRTLQANHNIDKGGNINLWAGGGITVASDCEAEYQECLDKVGNLLSVLSQENLDQ